MATENNSETAILTPRNSFPKDYSRMDSSILTKDGQTYDTQRIVIYIA